MRGNHDRNRHQRRDRQGRAPQRLDIQALQTGQGSDAVRPCAGGIDDYWCIEFLCCGSDKPVTRFTPDRRHLLTGYYLTAL